MEGTYWKVFYFFTLEKIRSTEFCDRTWNIGTYARLHIAVQESSLPVSALMWKGNANVTLELNSGVSSTTYLVHLMPSVCLYSSVVKSLYLAKINP